MYSIEGTRVALPPGAHHFRRVVACARCQRPAMDRSRPLYRRSDLHVEIAVLCDACAELPVSAPHAAPPDPAPPDARPPSAP